MCIFASQGLRFGSPFSPPLADLEYTRAMPPGGLSKLRPLDSRHRQRPMNKNLFVINLIWKHLLSTNKGNNKITELRTILQRESQNS